MVGKMIYKGLTSKVYECHDKTTKCKLCMKIEPIWVNPSELHDEALYLFMLLRSSMDGSSARFVPDLWWYDVCSAPTMPLRTIVTTMLGPTLETTCALTASQLGAVGVRVVEALEFVHSRNILHCSIKPENLAWSTTAPEALFGRCAATGRLTADVSLLDFGMSCLWRAADGSVCSRPRLVEVCHLCHQRRHASARTALHDRLIFRFRHFAPGPHRHVRWAQLHAEPAVSAA